MRRTCQFIAIIPCFNEAAHIARVVAEVRAHIPKVIVVDDGSTDSTAAEAAAAGAEVIRHPVNQGKGAALRSGWQRAVELGFTWALNLDGDGQHAPSDIPLFIACARNKNATLVIGNRLENTDSMPRLRRWTNRWMTRRISRLAGVAVADSQCGFRLMHLPTWSRLPVAADRFEIESELLIAFLAAGCSVRFVPVQVIYNDSVSKIRPLPDAWRWLKWWLMQRQKMRASRVRAGAPEFFQAVYPANISTVKNGS